MKETPEDFKLAISSLRESLREARHAETTGTTSSLLFDLLENQVQAIERFYELLINERNEKALISSPAFDELTQKHREVARYFARLPGVDSKSVYEKSIVVDFYYILRHHTREWGC